jgi:hypothetical protein
MRVLALYVLVACGRVSFDPLAGADASPGTLRTKRLALGSEHRTAGVAVGDRIMSLVGRDVSALTPPLAQTLLASGTPPVGMTIQIALDRAGSPVTATMTSVKW